MTVTISSDHAAQIVAMADASPGIEICGLLLGCSDCIDGIISAANVSDAPDRRFEVDPTVLFAAIRAERAGGPKVIGSYHSHPAGPAAPSVTDAAMIREAGELWLIAAGGQVSAWRANAAKGFDPVDLVLA